MPFINSKPFINSNCICTDSDDGQIWELSVVIVLQSQVWILRIEENDLSASVLPIGKTARILRSSLTFGKKMLSAYFASSEDTEMDS